MKKVLISSGGTSVPIDDVRKITNMSSGRFGCQIARVALKDSHRVYYLCAKGSRRPFVVDADLDRRSLDDIVEELAEINKLHRHSWYVERPYGTFDEYAGGLETLLRQEHPDITILAAAVSDFGVARTEGKISSGKNKSLKFEPLPKLIKHVKEWCPATMLVGFKLLSGSTPEQLKAAAMKQIKEAGSDLVVANDLTDLRAGQHKLTIFENDGASSVIGPSDRLAADLMKHIVDYHDWWRK